MPPSVRLTPTNFEEQMVRYGFFPEQVPDCFSSKNLADKIALIMPLIQCSVRQLNNAEKTTLPMTLSTYKNDISRRVLSLPNPEAYLRVVKLMRQNFAKIQSAAASQFSLSPITFIHLYSGFDIEAINSENLRDAKGLKSDYNEGILKCIRTSLGYKYKLSVDIANCYNSIYTHSIAWAICGKKQAKTYMRTKQPVTLRSDYELADNLDACTRFLKNNETNGILVGPFASRIFSEVILAAIDRELGQKGYIFMRYVDDYKFYFRSEAEAHQSVPLIEKILNEYNLNLNTSKTLVTRFPYETLSSIQELYANVLRSKGVFGVLTTANDLHLSGEKGAYKYALKYIRGQSLPIDKFDVIFATLVNIMLLDPKYGKYVICYLKTNKQKIDTNRLSVLVNAELRSSLSQELQQESLLFLHMIHELRLTIDAGNLLAILNSNEDFAIIIALDIWCHHKSLVTRTRSEAHGIKLSIKNLISSLAGENYYGSRWLLLYEIEMHGLFRGISYTPVQMNNFFSTLFQNGITFYLS